MLREGDPAQKPGKPVITGAEGLSDTRIRLEWNAVTGADYYRVHYAQSRDDVENNNAYVAPSVTGTTLTVDSLAPDTDYWFTLTAHNNGGAGDKAEAVKARTKAASAQPSAMPPGSTPTPPLVSPSPMPSTTPPPSPQPSSPPTPSVPPGTAAEQLAWIKANTDGGREYTITVNADETLAPQYLNYGGKIVKITLKSAGPRTISLNGNGSLFTVYSGVTLVLENLTLQGHSGNDSSLIAVAGTLIMNGGSVNGNKNVNIGGGITIFPGGIFTMNGGTISGNSASHGGGVWINGGSFTMTGGIISGNQAVAGGGVNVNGYIGASFSKTGNSVIYGDTDSTHTPGSTENTAANGNGHAVFWGRDSGFKQRNSTLPVRVDISTTDLTTNWE
jgi:hypothetical protein